MLLDALLLSKCDFLLKTTSAVAEFAIWVNLALHDAHLDLQWEDRFHSQRLPAWATPVGANDAQAYCDALERGCARDGGRGGGSTPLLQAGQACARCTPSVRLGDAAAAAGAHAVAAGTVCDGRNGLRLLSLAECVAFARRENVDFLGSQRELAEFPGCIQWNTRLVEFNDHAQQGAGCNLQGKGRCICTSTAGANGTSTGG